MPFEYLIKQYEQLHFEALTSQLLQALTAEPENKALWQLKTRTDCARLDLAALAKDQQHLDLWDPAYVQAAYIRQQKDFLESRIWQNKDLPALDQLKNQYIWCLYLMDEARIEEARIQLKHLQAALPPVPTPDTVRFYIDVYMSSGDLNTFAENELQAVKDYEKAIAVAEEYLPADDFKKIRQAFLYNNLADLYEQMEDFAQAEKAYRKAISLLESVQDLGITDLGGYQTALYGAAGNFYLLADEYDKAQQLLRKALAVLQNKELSFVNYKGAQAKTAFYLGLLYSYLDEPQRARAWLEPAYENQTELVKAGREKPLELARTAYYLASCIQDPDQEADLLKAAAKVFARQYPKDPGFYLGALGEIYNNLALLEPEQADSWYEQARFWFAKAYEAYPEDEELALSYAACLINAKQAHCASPEDAVQLRQLIAAGRHGQLTAEFEALLPYLN